LAATVRAHDRAYHPRAAAGQLGHFLWEVDEANATNGLASGIGGDERDRHPVVTGLVSGGLDPPGQRFPGRVGAPLLPPDLRQRDQQIRTVGQDFDRDGRGPSTLHGAHSS
jgi:hypothetical protein